MLTPKLPSFFKQSKNKAFEYKPLYYNEAREKMEERIEKTKRELKMEREGNGSSREDFRNKIEDRWNRKTREKGASPINIRLIIIIILIVIVFWYILK